MPMRDYQMIGFLAQALDELPDGVTGFAAAEAVAEFMGKAGYTIRPQPIGASLLRKLNASENT